MVDRAPTTYLGGAPMDETAPPATESLVAGPTIGIGRSILLSVVFYVVFLAVSTAIGTVWRSLGWQQLGMFSAIILPQLAAWTITILLGLQWARRDFRDVCPITGFPKRIVPALLVTSFGATILLLALASLIPIPEAMNRYIEAQRAQSGVLTIMLPVVIVAPIAEETFFRGLLLHCYLERYRVTKAVWASAIIFAVFHLNPWQATIALPLGLWFAWLVLRTGSILPGMLCHAMVNFSTNFLLGPLAVALGYSPEQLKAMKQFPPAILVLGAVAAVAGGTLLWQQLAGTPPLDAEPETLSS
jgi:CAAX protease family protein